MAAAGPVNERGNRLIADSKGHLRHPIGWFLLWKWRPVAPFLSICKHDAEPKQRKNEVTRLPLTGCQVTDGQRLAGFAQASESRMHQGQDRRISHGTERTGQSVG